MLNFLLFFIESTYNLGNYNYWRAVSMTCRNVKCTFVLTNPVCFIKKKENSCTQLMWLNKTRFFSKLIKNVLIVIKITHYVLSNEIKQHEVTPILTDIFFTPSAFSAKWSKWVRRKYMFTFFTFASLLHTWCVGMMFSCSVCGLPRVAHTSWALFKQSLRDVTQCSACAPSVSSSGLASDSTSASSSASVSSSVDTHCTGTRPPMFRSLSCWVFFLF